MQIRITLPDKREAHYIGANAINTAAQVGATTGIAYLKNRAYDSLLDSNAATKPGVTDTNEGWLRIPSKDGYSGMFGQEVPRNNLILETDDGIYIEFVDAKVKVVPENTIKCTPLVNRKGSVKELIQASDYKVTISGSVMVNSMYEFPYSEMKLLNSILKKPESLKVANAYLGIFGIERMVFQSGNFDQGASQFVNVMPFSLDFLSDEDYGFLVED